MRSFIAGALLATLLLRDAPFASGQPPAPGTSDAYCRNNGLTDTPDLKCCVQVVDWLSTGATRLSSDVCNYCLAQGICPQSNTGWSKVNSKTDICGTSGGQWAKVRARRDERVCRGRSAVAESGRADVQFRRLSVRA